MGAIGRPLRVVNPSWRTEMHKNEHVGLWRFGRAGFGFAASGRFPCRLPTAGLAAAGLAEGPAEGPAAGPAGIAGAFEPAAGPAERRTRNGACP